MPYNIGDRVRIRLAFSTVDATISDKREHGYFKGRPVYSFVSDKGKNYENETITIVGPATGEPRKALKLAATY
jgi:hypothetical protein